MAHTVEFRISNEDSEKLTKRAQNKIGVKDASTLVDMLIFSISGDCDDVSGDCGLGVVYDEKYGENNELLHTDITAQCSFENCAESCRVQKLADSIMRAAGLLPLNAN